MIAETILPLIRAEIAKRLGSGLSTDKALKMGTLLNNPEKMASIITSCLDGNLTQEEMTSKIVDKMYDEC